jgi:hypothetical protein
MVPDHYYDLLEGSGSLLIEAWRCICCGNIMDPTIVKNRQMGDRLTLVRHVTVR